MQQSQPYQQRQMLMQGHQAQPGQQDILWHTRPRRKHANGLSGSSLWQNRVQPVVMSNQCCHCIQISYLLSCLFLIPCNWPCSGGVSFLVSKHITCLHACSLQMAL